ncbi:ylmG homolog protein 2, chloroplastic [Humulus lupulus]|uniref:ylmG homolog protein 2, chloroplastic n=1 Tax=Humulus lupulus TaxID=3486 RepID=UPI002B40842B|nr:ylmG homolog protein 2, chloroplastic [Humulus lupulus]
MAPIPNELSSSSMAETSKPNFVPNCGTLLLSFPKFAPFLKASSPSATSSSSRKPNFIPPDIFAIAQNLHTSVLSAAHNSLRNLHSFASQNPLLNKLLSLNSFHQIRGRRNYRCVNSISAHNFAAVLPGDSVAGLVVANGLSNFLNLYNTVLIVRLVLTWFPNAPPAIVSPLSTICDPYLNIFRGIIPPLGGTLDLSPILAFLVLNAFTSTAAALPAELPATELPNQESSSSPARYSHVTTTSHKKWLRRVQGHGSGIRTKSSSDSH